MALITYITTIQFGFRAVGLLGQECDRLSVRRPLLVTDSGVRAAGLLDRVAAQFGQATPLTVFDDTPSNPTEAAVRQGVAAYREAGCDGIIALGGGSPIDLAKGVALAATHDGPLSAYAAIEGGAARITSAVAPVIAIPTTAGTGSEVGRAGRHHPRGRAQGGAAFAASGTEARDLRPGTDLRPAALSDRRHRHGRYLALH